MTKREIELQIKLIKDQLTLAQQEKAEFVDKLEGLRGYEEFINERLERLKYLIELYKTIDNAEN